MSEISDETGTALPPAMERFILRWGDMATQWGMSRSVCQVQAFLYLQDEPRTAEAIAAALGLARSNVSVSLKELLAWTLIRRVPVLGDRRDHFEAETDVWDIARRISLRRKEREIDPVLATLRSCVAEADAGLSPTAARRLRAMLDFTEAMDRWYAQMTGLPRSQLAALVKIGARVASLLPKAR